jgi:hypothetical protein
MPFGILAAVAALLGYVLNGSGSHTNAWLSPLSLLLLAVALLALHVSGVFTGGRKQ